MHICWLKKEGIMKTRLQRVCEVKICLMHIGPAISEGERTLCKITL